MGAIGATMTNPRADIQELLQRARQGDEQALGALFDHFRKRLKRMVRLRMDHRLKGRVDPSDVLQEAYLEAARRFAKYAAESSLPLFLWLRLVTGQKLTDIHRFHLGAQMRTAAREISLHHGPMPQASTASLAAQLLGRMTSASEAAIRAETTLRVEEAINSMDPIDREVIALRHFEHLTNEETAQVLGISSNAASNRYVRAVKRLKELLSAIPGLEP
jgi:RNA polymerase sigma-70 factor (ECF subfamily)